MAQSDQQSSGLIATTLHFAKKIAVTGFEVIQDVAPNRMNKLQQAPNSAQVVEGEATTKNTTTNSMQFNDPQQMMREYFPLVSHQLLGRHYKTINHIVTFVAPSFNDKVADYLFERLNDTVANLSSSQALVVEVGAENLDELSHDPARSARISMALCNQNKIIAAMQGGVSGMGGVIGAAVDVPFSMGLALRGIYQTGHAYGFELNSEDHPIVAYIFRQIDLGSVAEKQAVLATIHSMALILKGYDLKHLQQLLGSVNNVDYLKKYLVDEQGGFKWAWLQHLPQTRLLAKLAPLANLGVGARYSMQLVEDASRHAQHVFHHARLYLLENPDADLDPLSAYQQVLQQQAQTQYLLAHATESVIADASNGASNA